MSIAVPPRPQTLADLAKVEGKAELIGGRIVRHMATGRLPSRIAKRILRSLDDHETASGVGESFGDSLGYALPQPLPNGRQSFQPDASYYVGTAPYDEEGFLEGVPTVAVEVRSEHDYTPAKDREYAEKRADYFAAGTLVVWDVDYRAQTVSKYTAADPLAPVVFRRGEVADAEPALPGWRLPVDDIFA
jgi:Uma2 family endonuclease